MNETEEITLAIIGESLKSLHAKVDEKFTEIKTHETRITVMENWKNIVNTGIGWVLAPTVAVIVSAILYLAIKK